MWRHVTLFILFATQRAFTETCPPREDTTPCSCIDSGHGINVYCSHLESLEQLMNSVRGLYKRNILSFDIKNSKFDYLPHDLFENVTIKHLSISESNLSRIGVLGHPQFMGLENSLETLKFTNTFTREHPFAYVSMEHLNLLTTLELRKSYVEVIQNDYFKRGPKSLKILRFVEGNIERISYKAFKQLKNLKILDLSDNKLTYIPREALPEPAMFLEELNLERNKMEDLPEDIFRNMPNLKIVNLELNEISTIDETIWKPIWNHLELLNIDYNPMICDKKIKWIYDSNKNLEQKLIATCYKPFNLMDRDLHSLKPEELK